VHYFCITCQSKNAAAGGMLKSNLFGQIILGVFLPLYFFKPCYLQGIKIRNMLLFNVLNKNRFPVIFAFFPVIFPVNPPVIP